MEVGNRVNKVEIKKGWYYTAGRKFGWLNDGLDMAGVGINQSFLKDCDELHISVAGAIYRVSCEQVREFVRKYKSAERMPGGSLIGIVSKSILEEI
jgi:hypothetical protein